MSRTLDYPTILIRARASLSIGLEYPVAEVAAACGVSIRAVRKWAACADGSLSIRRRPATGRRGQPGFIQSLELLQFLQERARRQIRLHGRDTAA